MSDYYDNGYSLQQADDEISALRERIEALEAIIAEARDAIGLAKTALKVGTPDYNLDDIEEFVSRADAALNDKSAATPKDGG